MVVSSKGIMEKEEIKIRLNGNIYWLNELKNKIGNVMIETVDNGDEGTVIDLVEIIDDLTEIEGEV